MLLRASPCLVPFDQIANGSGLSDSAFEGKTRRFEIKPQYLLKVGIYSTSLEMSPD